MRDKEFLKADVNNLVTSIVERLDTDRSETIAAVDNIVDEMIGECIRELVSARYETLSLKELAHLKVVVHEYKQALLSTNEDKPRRGRPRREPARADA